MPTSLELSFAVDTYDRVNPLVDGRVKPDGVDLIPFRYRSPERHRRLLNHQEFDICELSFASYLAGFEDGIGYSAIPVFPHRLFRHSYYFLHSESGIENPSDLEGKRVGIRRWQNTASLWMRGIARDYYDIDLGTIEWFIEDEDEVPIDIPDHYSTTRIPDDRNINEMLVSGDIDAAMYPKRLSSLRAGTDRIRRLFPDYKAEEIRYYQDTGCFPIMHVVVIRDEIIEEHPWVPMNVQKAFEEAKHVGLKELEHTRRYSLIWGRMLLEEQGEIMTDDPWSNTVEGNRTELEQMVSYACTDGLMEKPVDIESLFVASALEDLPEHS